MVNPKPIVVHKPSKPAISVNGSVVLCTLNARYIHASLGLRYLMANMGPLESNTRIAEFTINQRTSDIAEQLLALDADIIGFGVYIWNIKETTELVALIKNIKPSIKIIIGGPEVSYEYENTDILQYSDHLITGQADFEFANVCQQILQKNGSLAKVTKAINPNVDELKPPYAYYNDEDIRNRVLYVEASRGCPFKCEFCLSALDKTAWPFELTTFLQELKTLYDRGARRFKFVDRTFNLKMTNCTTILQFFLDRLKEDSNLFLHFEVIPDKLPDTLKEMIQLFPQGSLQFEIGIQSFNPQVQDNISRRQDIENTINNVNWLRRESNAHIHADLIFGLPGESLESFAQGFDQLVQLQPHEIQLGILKRLRGTPIVKQTIEYDMRYAEQAPYQLLQNRDVSFQTMQRVQRFARYWDLIANSGRFKNTLALLLKPNPFQQFMQLSDWIYELTGQTHQIAYTRLMKLIYSGAMATNLCSSEELFIALESDCLLHGEKHPPRWISQRSPAPTGPKPQADPSDTRVDACLPVSSGAKLGSTASSPATPSRQHRHISATESK